MAGRVDLHVSRIKSIDAKTSFSEKLASLSALNPFNKFALAPVGA
jgi:hypothetical protein